MCFGVDHSRGFFSFQQQKRSQQCENGKDNRRKEPYLQVVAEHAGNKAYKRGACRTAQISREGQQCKQRRSPVGQRFCRRGEGSRPKYPYKQAAYGAAYEIQNRQGRQSDQQIRADTADGSDNEEFFERDLLSDFA